jgi:hypothetical protein
VLSEPGYDRQSAIVYKPSTNYLEIGDPSQAEARDAALELLQVICDFPLKDGHHAAAWLAGVLTPLARNAFSGPSPMIVFDANTRGSGKSLLADVTAAIVSGRAMARMSQAKDEDEERKRITSIALQGDPLAFIDNVTRILGSSALDAALTSTIWAERVLGGNERPHLPLRCCWYATGNNVALRGDTARRCLHVRLESQLENPEDRTGFAHPDLLGWVGENRSRLVSYALMVLRGYCLAGRPDLGLRPWGSFQSWSNLVRNSLVWAGCEDPGVTRLELREIGDLDAGALPGLLDGIEQIARAIGVRTEDGVHAITARKIADTLEESRTGYEPLREALSALGVRTTGRAIGARLRSFRNRWVTGRCLVARRVGNTSYWGIASKA